MNLEEKALPLKSHHSEAQPASRAAGDSLPATVGGALGQDGEAWIRGPAPYWLARPASVFVWPSSLSLCMPSLLIRTLALNSGLTLIQSDLITILTLVISTRSHFPIRLREFQVRVNSSQLPRPSLPIPWVKARISRPFGGRGCGRRQYCLAPFRYLNQVSPTRPFLWVR